MNISLTYTGQLDEAAGTSGEAIHLDPPATLATLLSTIAMSHGNKFENLLQDSSGALRPTVLVAIDGTQATGDRETLSLDGVREIVFMTPIAGG